jgi:hypothetical protein
MPNDVDNTLHLHTSGLEDISLAFGYYTYSVSPYTRQREPSYRSAAIIADVQSASHIHASDKVLFDVVAANIEHLHFSDKVLFDVVAANIEHLHFADKTKVKIAVSENAWSDEVLLVFGSYLFGTSPYTRQGAPQPISIHRQTVDHVMALISAANTTHLHTAGRAYIIIKSHNALHLHTVERGMVDIDVAGIEHLHFVDKAGILVDPAHTEHGHTVTHAPVIILPGAPIHAHFADKVEVVIDTHNTVHRHYVFTLPGPYSITRAILIDSETFAILHFHH